MEEARRGPRGRARGRGRAEGRAPSVRRRESARGRVDRLGVRRRPRGRRARRPCSCPSCPRCRGGSPCPRRRRRRGSGAGQACLDRAARRRGLPVARGFAAPTRSRKAARPEPAQLRDDSAQETPPGRSTAFAPESVEDVRDLLAAVPRVDRDVDGAQPVMAEERDDDLGRRFRRGRPRGRRGSIARAARPRA